jgi:hypothetical protein
MNEKYALIKNDLLKSGAVTAVTRSNSPVIYTWIGTIIIHGRGSNPQVKTWIAEYHIDNDFLETTGLKLIAGRDINSSQFPTDSSSILLNESAVKLMGFKDPIGQIVRNNQKSWVVVGIIKDFVPNSPFYEIPR